MKLKNYATLLFLILLSTTLSCSKDDESVEPCHATQITIKINGELHTFTPAGRGIDIIWETGGYDLMLRFYGSIDRANENLGLDMIYKKTGYNVIDKLRLTLDDGEHVGVYNLVNDDFESDVIINRSECFYATFSGKINDDGEELIITDGIISYEYDEPFSE